MTDAEPNNPLGLNLDFLFGRGYLWAKHERLSDWITLEHLRMEIPDLTFPFDARGGLHRFRNTRSLVREIEMSTSEVGLGDLLREAAADIEGFEDVDVHFLDGAVHISTRVRALGSDTFLSFRAALIPPEPARADEVHLSLYDYRAFGPLPYPARLLAFELMTRLLNTPLLKPPGRGDSFTVGIAGDILSFRPLKLILLHIFPRVGWKLPNLSDVVLEGTQIRPGALTIRATSLDGKWRPEEKPSFRLTATKEGARALAAYEAKDLFANADEALFDRQPRQAMQLFAGYRDLYGLHPALVARTFDGLLSDPSPGHVAEAESLVRELTRDDPDDLHAALALPTIALLSGRSDAVIKAYDRLSQLLRERGETHDWVLCELAASHWLSGRDPEQAAQRLREVLKVSPRNRTALERLRSLYDELGQGSGLEEVLKRLTGVYTDRESLTQTYLSLARHLLDREGELGEARIYLERVLRLDPGQLEALNTLGESYVMSGEPLRALRAFGSAARAAESRGGRDRAAELLFRVARLWHEEVGDPGQALLTVRRALELSSESVDEDLTGRAEQLAFAARVSEERERFDEALRYWGEATPLLEQMREQAAAAGHTETVDAFDERLVEAHRRLASIYARRDRMEAAASHWRRILEFAPTDRDAADQLADHYRGFGKPEALIELYSSLLKRSLGLERSVDLQTSLGDIYAQMGMNEEAREAYTEALRVAPTASRARKRLVDLLTGNERFETLRDALNGLLLRAQDRDARWGVLLDLGDLQLRHLRQPENAVRTYFEAVQIRPSRLEGLFRTREALEAVAEEKGLEVPSPMGDGTVGDLLLRVLERLAEVAPDDRDRVGVLARLAQVARKLDDETAVREAKRRIESLKDVRLDREAVDERLDAIVDEGAIGLAESTASESDEPDPLPHRATPEAPPRKQGLPDEAEKLTSFRKRFEAAKKESSSVPRADEVDPDSSIGRVLRRQNDETAGEEAQQASQQEGRQEDAEADETTPTGDTLTGVEPVPRSSRSDDDPAPDGGEAGQFDSQPTAVLEAPPQHTPESPRVQAARQAVETSRRTADHAALADSLENLLAIDGLAQAVALDARKELGELYYYDLEDADAALPHLEAVRDADPDGRGADTGLLNALEAIYEEAGRAEGRLAILEDRLDRAESDEMRTVYRLLIAQLVWETHRDRDTTSEWLAPILERDPRHEAAHRLLADVATDLDDWAAAAEHYATVLETSAGGLDAVETERQLANIYLQKLDNPEAALTHFESVLEAAPGDAQALEGYRQAQAATGDWTGYCASLGKELGLLLGRPEGFTPADIIKLDVGEVADALRVPASQIVADIAEVVENELEKRDLARRLWGTVVQLWGEHVEALERRIALDRSLGVHRDLAEDLEAYADMLLDAHERFDALVECAMLHADLLDDPDAARPLLTEALAIVEGTDEQPDGVDAARRALRALRS